MTDTSCLNVNKKGRQGTPSAPWDLERARFRLNITKKTDSGIHSVGPSQQPSHVQEKRIGKKALILNHSAKNFFSVLFNTSNSPVINSATTLSDLDETSQVSFIFFQGKGFMVEVVLRLVKPQRNSYHARLQLRFCR
ncbi:hypothetical protein TNCV_4198081 [Trichonephila clavipes]|nr:hypothetical protein TNCV_4198081 [Trichonephila clavipes]